MNKEEKRIKTLSVSQLYTELASLEEELKIARNKQYNALIEQLVEEDVSDKRIIQDILWITGGFFTFNLMYAFLTRPIQDPVWMNYVCSGLCAVATAMSIAATRMGWNKTNAKYGADIRRHYQFSPEDVEKRRPGASRTTEDIIVKQLEKKRDLYNKYIIAKRNEGLSEADKAAVNEFFGRY